MILANDFSFGLIRFQKLLAQMANRVLLDLARAGIVFLVANQPATWEADWSTEIIVCTASLRLKLQIKVAIAPSCKTLTNALVLTP